jgi:glutathione S-transferase
LWGVETPRTLRPHWLLAELGIPYECREILPRSSEMQSPEFLALAPRRKVPILEDGDLVIGESGAILLHLASRYGGGRGWVPEPASPQRAHFDDLCFFTLTELDAPLYVIRRHADLPEVYGESVVAVEAARAYFLRQVEETQRQFSNGRPHLLGDTFSVADILLVSCLTWADFIGIEVEQELEDYRDRLIQRPAYRAASRANFPAAQNSAMPAARSSGT